MAKPVLFRHPAPVRFVPARGVHVRRAFAKVDTPVMLTEISAAEMQEVGRDDQGGFCLHDGHLWRQAPGHETVESIVESVDGEFPTDYSTTRRRYARHAFMARSPLLATVPHCLRSWHPMPAVTPRSVVHDGTDRARLDLAEYVEGNLRLVEGKPFFRIRGPLISLGYDPCPYVGLEGVWDYGGAGNVAARQRLDLACELVGERVAVEIREALAADSKASDRLPPLEDAKDDVLHFLNTVGEALMDVNWGAVLRVDHDGYAGPAHDAVIRRMTPWAELGMLGSVRLDDAPAVLEDAALSCHASIEAIEEEGFHAPEILQRLLDFIEGYVEPSMRADLAPEDEAELDLLVEPGP